MVGYKWIVNAVQSFWADCRYSSLMNIYSTLEGITFEKFLDLCQGKVYITNEGDILEFEGRLVEEFQIPALEECIEDSYDNYLSELACTYVDLMNDPEEIDINDIIHDSIEIHSKLNDLISFSRLLLDYNLSNIYNNLNLESNLVDKVEQIREDRERNNSWDSYSFRSPSKLSFKHKDAFIRLDIPQLQMCQATGVNGLSYLPEHKRAQEIAESERDHYILENLFDTVWNSGWLSPNGLIYGCSDLSHTLFTEDLLKEVYPYVDPSNYKDLDSTMDDLGFIKFSQGRWFLINLDPTREQYKTIIKWAEDRADVTRIVFGESISDIVYVDVLKTISESAFVCN